jgi:chromosome segregation ATPase
MSENYETAIIRLARERNTLASRLAEVEAERDKARTERNYARTEVARFKRCIEQKGGSEHSPTQWAYDQACEAIDKHRTRADALQREVEALVNAATPFVAPMQNADFSRQLRQHEELVAAIKSARAALETRSEQGGW